MNACSLIATFEHRLPPSNLRLPHIPCVQCQMTACRILSVNCESSYGKFKYSLMVVSDVREFFEKNAEAKKVKFSLCSKQLIFHKGSMNLNDYLLKVHPLRSKKKRKRRKSKSEAVSSDEFLWLQQCSEARLQEITGCSAKLQRLQRFSLRSFKGQISTFIAALVRSYENLEGQQRPFHTTPLHTFRARWTISPVGMKRVQLCWRKSMWRGRQKCPWHTKKSSHVIPLYRAGSYTSISNYLQFWFRTRSSAIQSF